MEYVTGPENGQRAVVQGCSGFLWPGPGSAQGGGAVLWIVTQGNNTAPRTVKPIKGRILVRQDEKEERVGKSKIIIAPQGSENWPSYGTVIAVGPGDFDECGERIPPAVQVGDRVLFKRRPASALNPDVREGASDWDGQVMLHAEDILGVVEEE